MAANPTTLFRGAATVTLTTTLYTVPASTTAVVTDIVVTNTDNTNAHTVTITLDGTDLLNDVTVSANSFLTVSIKQVLTTTKIIQGGASSTSVNLHISGVQIT